MTSLTVGKIHNEYLKVDITTVCKNLEKLCTHTNSLQKLLKVSPSHDLASGKTGYSTLNTPDTASIRKAVHTHASIIFNLLHVHLAHWTTIESPAIIDMDAAEWDELDMHKSIITELREQYDGLCVAINPLLACYGEKLVIEDQKLKKNDDSIWVTV